MMMHVLGIFLWFHFYCSSQEIYKLTILQLQATDEITKSTSKIHIKSKLETVSDFYHTIIVLVPLTVIKYQIFLDFIYSSLHI